MIVNTPFANDSSLVEPHKMRSSESAALTHLSDLSIGVELEGLLFFKEELLLPLLEPGVVIDKDLIDYQGKRWLTKAIPGWGLDWNGKRISFQPYRSEGIKLCRALIANAAAAEQATAANKTPSSTLGSEDIGSDAGSGSKGSGSMDFGSDGKDADDDQNQRMDTDATSLQSDLEDGGAGHDDHALPERTNRKAPYPTALPWGVINDGSIIGFTSEEKNTFGYDPNEWDTTGVEFVSEVYIVGGDGQTIAQLQHDVEQLESALNTDESAIAVNKTCGFHLHIGRPDNTLFPIHMLRVLKFITLVFEREISKLFAVHRGHQDHEDSSIRPNLMCWRTRNFETFTADSKIIEDAETGEAKNFRSKHVSIASMRADIFEEDGTVVDGDAYKYLKELSWEKRARFETRRHITNWDNIDGKNHVYSYGELDESQNPAITATYDRPPTIEFRQPEGTFDSIAIGHIVQFYLALVRYAIKLAPEGRNVLPEIDTWDSHAIDIEYLFENLELPAETKVYLENRVDRREVDMIADFGDAALFEDVTEYEMWEECDENGRRPEDDQAPLEDGEDDDDAY